MDPRTYKKLDVVAEKKLPALDIELFERTLGIAARNHYTKSQVYVALGSVTLHSALPSYVHGYARGHTTGVILLYLRGSVPRSCADPTVNV